MRKLINRNYQTGPCQKSNVVTQFLWDILRTDEAHFTFHGSVNTDICRIWTKKSPHAYTEKPLNLPRVSVHGFTASSIVGHIFLDECCAKPG